MLCSVCILFSLSGVSEERRSLIKEKSKMKMEQDPEVLVKGKNEILRIDRLFACTGACV